MTSIFTTLAAYGFQSTARNSMMWGIGSLVWGHIATVTYTGDDTYIVTIHQWLYDQDGDPIRDSKETRTLHGALALAWIFNEMPRSFWRR